MDWLVELNAALGAVQRAGPLIATLATVDEAGRPRARSVVCRRIDDDGSAWIASDARSDKNEQVREDRWAELVVWLPQPRQQFRLAGEVYVLGPDDPSGRRRALWDGLTDASRSLFVWPPPGAKREANPAAFPEGVAATVEPPESFEILILRPSLVEQLDLQPHPHRRRRWRATRAWEAEELNP